MESHINHSACEGFVLEEHESMVRERVVVSTSARSRLHADT